MNKQCKERIQSGQLPEIFFSYVSLDTFLRFTNTMLIQTELAKNSEFSSAKSELALLQSDMISTLNKNKEKSEEYRKGVIEYYDINSP